MENEALKNLLVELIKVNKEGLKKHLEGKENAVKQGWKDLATNYDKLVNYYEGKVKAYEEVLRVLGE